MNKFKYLLLILIITFCLFIYLLTEVIIVLPTLLSFLNVSIIFIISALFLPAFIIILFSLIGLLDQTTFFKGIIYNSKNSIIKWYFPIILVILYLGTYNLYVITNNYDTIVDGIIWNILLIFILLGFNFSIVINIMKIYINKEKIKKFLKKVW
jgi:hypothetical protein